MSDVQHRRVWSLTTGKLIDECCVDDTPDEELMLEARQVVADALREASPEERTDEGLLRAKVQADLRRFLRKRTQRQPLVLPVIVEL